MKQFFVQHLLIATVMVLLVVLSIICQIIIGVLYQNMIQETDNMSSTENKLLKQCKLKFANCFQLNAGVSNIPVFVDKFLNRIHFFGMTFSGLHHLSGQLMLLSVFAGGIGVCKGIAEGESIRQILPFYIFSFFGLYLYFSITSFIDMQAKHRILKTNLIDYLENHMVNRLSMNIEEAEQLNEIEKKEKPVKIKGFGKAEQEELEELLKEFLV